MVSAMKKMSVKLKITLWYALAMAVVSGLVLFTMNSFADDMIRNDMEMRMTRVVRSMAKEIVDKHGNLRPIPEFRYYDSGVHLILYDENGRIVGGVNPFSITDEFTLNDNEFRQNVYDGDPYYEFDKEIRSKTGTYYLKGISSASDELSKGNPALKSNAAVFLAMILIAAFGGYFMISRALVPVKKISQTAERISESSDLSQRISIGEDGGHDEIYHLAIVFDKMLDKIDATLQREKQFTSDASHELRTPVAVILSECEYMEECAKTIDEYRESADSVKRQADRMSKLISELLMLSRMDRNTIQTNFENVDLSELVSFICDEQEKIHSGGVQLLRRIVPGVTARADRFLMMRALINLISNAYQYIGGGSRIEVSLNREGDDVVFAVTDDGIGIREEDLPKIWERFYQADASRTADGNGGAGLGLSMVKWIAECHGGTVLVQSKPGEGSCFSLRFPAQV